MDAVWGVMEAATLMAETGQPVTWNGEGFIVAGLYLSSPDAVRTFAASWPA